MVAFVDMAKKPEEIAKDYTGPAVIGSPSIYPYGLCLCLGKDELEKLNLDDDCEVGDYLDLRALAKVTSVSKNETTDGQSIRIELQITHMAAENESHEDDGEEADEPAHKVKNPYKK